ncbi:hypothetical protein EVAR_57709_1 [Eumeta japonica]|uniref:Uncharacterized protein n=1 Tax=Eumeta variegata TaxID=151549 RepID=A0A4C1YA32_EUMVA|nr:hypothetical protein EVAR_57709_1 [Eumeta japonica]
MLGRNSKLSLRNKPTLCLMCTRTVLTYMSPVYAHAAPNTPIKLQVLQNKFCRATTDAHWSSPMLWTTFGLDNKMDPTRVGVPVLPVLRGSHRNPPQGKSRAVNTPVCCPAAYGEAE